MSRSTSLTAPAALPAEAEAHPRIGSEIADPVRPVAAAGEGVDPLTVRREPQLHEPPSAGAAADRREVADVVRAVLRQKGRERHAHPQAAATAVSAVAAAPAIRARREAISLSYTWVSSSRGGRGQTFV